jgi:hypothetical protein
MNIYPKAKLSHMEFMIYKQIKATYLSEAVVKQQILYWIIYFGGGGNMASINTQKLKIF